MPLATTESVWEANSRYIFGVNTPERRWTRAIFTVMVGCHVDTLVILVDKALMDLGSPLGARKWAGRFGMKILFLESVNRQDPAEQLRRARDAGAHAIVVWGYFDDAVAVRRALAEIGWTPRLFFSQVAPALEKYGKVLGDLADYSLGCSIWEPDIGRHFPGGVEFLESFREEYKREPSYHAANGYAAGTILAEAISRAGSTDREKIREVLSALDMITLIGRYGVDERGVQMRQRPVIVQWQNGRKMVVWPEPLSTAPLVFPPGSKP